MGCLKRRLFAMPRKPASRTDHVRQLPVGRALNKAVSLSCTQGACRLVGRQAASLTQPNNSLLPPPSLPCSNIFPVWALGMYRTKVLQHK